MTLVSLILSASILANHHRWATSTPSLLHPSPIFLLFTSFPSFSPLSNIVVVGVDHRTTTDMVALHFLFSLVGNPKCNHYTSSFSTSSPHHFIFQPMKTSTSIKCHQRRWPDQPPKNQTTKKILPLPSSYSCWKETPNNRRRLPLSIAKWWVRTHT